MVHIKSKHHSLLISFSLHWLLIETITLFAQVWNFKKF